MAQIDDQNKKVKKGVCKLKRLGLGVESGVRPNASVSFVLGLNDLFHLDERA